VSTSESPSSRPSSGPIAPEGMEIVDWLVSHVAQRLTLPPEEIDPREPLASYGLSSTEGVALSGDLEEWLGRDLPATLVWDYPTIEKLASYLAVETVPAGAGVGAV
jgi:phthiocerol/phenolphthiocerol synthesis type-I polyketide synthase C